MVLGCWVCNKDAGRRAALLSKFLIAPRLSRQEVPHSSLILHVVWNIFMEWVLFIATSSLKIFYSSDRHVLVASQTQGQTTPTDVNKKVGFLFVGQDFLTSGQQCTSHFLISYFLSLGFLFLYNE